MTERQLAAELRAVGVPEYDTEARIIFRELSGKSAAELALKRTELDGEVLLPIIERRKKREPLAYILGVWYFCFESYLVTEDVLIPRRDTELLVTSAAREIKRGGRILDLCTGSGCVGISTLRMTEKTTALLVDISESALDVAKRNAERNGVAGRCELVCLDVLRELPFGEFDAILSNPPYVTCSEYGELEPELYYEPRAAFVGGEDGLDFYRALIPRLGDILAEGGFIAFEIGESQAEAVGMLAVRYGYRYEIERDFAQHNRVLILRRFDDANPYCPDED